MENEGYSKLMEDEYEDACSLKNRYSFLNANLFPMLSKEEQDVFTDMQEKLSKFQKDVKAIKDVYEIFPKLGENYLLQRLNPYKGMEGNTKLQLLLALCTAQLSPEVDMAMAASAILGGNALCHVTEPNDVILKAIDEIFTGKKIACIGITEMDRGSDAVNQECMSKINEDGSLTMNGTKIYTTNGPKADYFVAYGVTDLIDPRRSMTQGLFTREHGVKTSRLCIPAAPLVHIGKTYFDNVTCPKEYVLAGPGLGYKRLFEGLVPERLTIIGSSLGSAWTALATASIFTQMRFQFGKPLFSYQGISHVMADLFSRISAYTSFAFQSAGFYEKKIAEVKRAGQVPNKMDESYAAVLASQGKYLTAKIAHETAYEMVQVMGGRGALDEPGSSVIINKVENLTRISEVVGGHRNVQLMIVQGALAAASQMNIGRQMKKLGKKEIAKAEVRAKLMIEKAGALLASKDQLGDAGDVLEKAKSEFEAAVASGDAKKAEFFGKSLGKALAEAGKALYKAQKQ